MNFVFCPRRRRKGITHENSPKLNCAERKSIIKRKTSTHKAHALVVSSSKPPRREREKEFSAHRFFEEHTYARFFSESGVVNSFWEENASETKRDQQWKTKTARNSNNKKKTRSIRTTSSSTRHRRRRQEVNNGRDTRRRRTTTPIARRDVEVVVVVVSSKW